MKILHYIPTIGKSGGGVSAYLQLLAASLGEMVELHIVSHHSTDEMKLENCQVHFIEGSIKHPVRMKREYCTLLDVLTPDVVHINGCWMLQCSWTVFWAKSKGYPVVLSAHGMLEPWDIKKNYWTKKLPALLLYQKRAVKIADVLVATAETERNNLIKLGYNENVAVVPNGIIIDGVVIKRSWEERKQMLFLALYRRNKGLDLLMQAVAHMKNELNDWKVIIAGIESDYSVSELKSMAEKLEIDSIVDIIGGLFGDTKWNTYRESDVFILPTLNENFGIVIAESLLCGTPVITTKGAPWPQIAEYGCGWWIDRSVDNLVSAINEFIHTSVEKRQEMGKKGRKLVEDNFSSKKVAADMIELYGKILKGI